MRCLPRCLLALFAGLSLACTAQAGGWAFPRNEQDKLEISEQRMIVHFDQEKSVESLILDSQCTDEYARAYEKEHVLVVPLPAVPTQVSSGTLGAFDTLESLTMPRVESGRGIDCYVATELKKTAWVGLFLLAVLIACRVRWWMCLIEIGIVLFVFEGQTHIKRAPMMFFGSHGIVIGHHESIQANTPVIISGPNGAGVKQWFDDNGYALPEPEATEIDRLAKTGWCFAVAKIPVDSPPSSPMKFVFPTQQAVLPVYGAFFGQTRPMAMDVFVLGKQEAKVAGLRAGCVARRDDMVYAQQDSEAWPTRYAMDGRRAKEEMPLPLLHPELRPYAPSSPTITWLHGDVLPDAVREEMKMDWVEPTYRHDYAYSAEWVFDRVFETSAWCLLAGLLVLAVCIRLQRKFLIMASALAAILGPAAAAQIVRVQFPIQQEDRFHGPIFPQGPSASLMIQLERWAEFEGLSSILEKASATARPMRGEDVRSAIQKAIYAHDADTYYSQRNTHVFAPILHEGDSPLNYAIRGEGKSLAVFFYDHVGMEHRVWPVAND